MAATGRWRGRLLRGVRTSLLASIALTGGLPLLLRTDAMALGVAPALADVDSFRGALGETWVRAVLRAPGEATDLVFRSSEDGLAIEGGSAWTARSGDLEMEQRLVAIALGQEPVRAAVASVAGVFEPQPLGFVVVSFPGGDEVLAAYGDDRAIVYVEPGVARPRLYRVLAGGEWLVALSGYGEGHRAWVPGRVDLSRDGVPVATLVVTDVARLRADLAPAGIPTRVDAPGPVPPRLPL